jgi:hypothetical protein
MSAVDTGFLVIFILLFGALSIADFVQADKTPYQRYFGILYMFIAISLMILGWNSMR